MSKKCILSQVSLTDENDSKAHIIPSALGGSLKPKGILSIAANSELNDKFDAPLVKALSPIMAMIGGIPDRSDLQPTILTDRTGREYKYKYGGKIKPNSPSFTKTTSGNYDNYFIEARTTKELKTLAGRIKKDHPNINIEDMISSAKVQDTYIKGRLGASLSVGPNVFFPAIYVMASIYSCYNQSQPHPKFVEFVRNFNSTSLVTDDLSSATMPPDTFYWIHNDKIWFENEAEVSHLIFLFNDPEKKQALFYCELFNLPGIAVILPSISDDYSLSSYCVNVLDGTDIDVKIDQDFLKNQSWTPTHNWPPSQDLRDVLQKKTLRLLNIADTRSENLEINRLIKEKAGDFPEDHLLSEEETQKIVKLMIDLKISKILRGL